MSHTQHARNVHAQCGAKTLHTRLGQPSCFKNVCCLRFCPFLACFFRGRLRFDLLRTGQYVPFLLCPLHCNGASQVRPSTQSLRVHVFTDMFFLSCGFPRATGMGYYGFSLYPLPLLLCGIRRGLSRPSTLGATTRARLRADTLRTPRPSLPCFLCTCGVDCRLISLLGSARLCADIARIFVSSLSFLRLM